MSESTEPTQATEATWEDVLPRMSDVDPDRLAMVTKRLRSAIAQKDLSPRRQALADLADATRDLIDRLVATDAPDDVILAAVADLRSAADRFAGYRCGTFYGFSEAANAGATFEPVFDHSPMIGIANPLAPPITLEPHDDRVVGHAVFSHAYEGPPGCVHGGYVAAAFDEILGAAQSLSGAPGMTGTLAIRYESPTPIAVPLRFEARLVGVERRKIFVEGTCHVEDRLTATAKGTFISLQAGKFLSMLEERAARKEGDA
ncbi:MAG: PaaI family thioesterase [Acidimicrobiales bacterium]|nr:PaaI family thioesterase [Acidimicrobiales bacterium]